MHRSVTIALLLLISLSGCKTLFKKDPKLLTQDYSHLIYIKDNIRKNSPIYMLAYQRLCKEAECLIDDDSDVQYARMGFPEQKGYMEDLLNKEQMNGAVSHSDLLNCPSDTFNDYGWDNTIGSYRKKLDQMVDNVTTLSMAWFFTEQEKYANEATRIICEWFLEKDEDSGPFFISNGTNQLPYETGDFSIVDSRRYIEIVDALKLIESSKAWDHMKTRRVKKWFSEYLGWLLSSEEGKITAGLQNHVGTWYKAMVASFGFFIDDKDIVWQAIHESMDKYLVFQIDTSGIQPIETGTSCSFNNSLSNLEAHFILAKIAAWNKIDYCHHDVEGKGNIKKAADYLFRYIGNMEEWPYVQVSEVDARSMFKLVLTSQNLYQDSKYDEFIQKLYPELSSNDRLLISVRMHH